jgi:hypothetical protein
VTWMSRALCRTRPPEWWEVPSDGNRLALALCSVCPERAGCSDDQAAGVIRGGVAFGDDGERLPMCSCGRPVPYPVRAVCYTCMPSQHTVIPKPRRRGRPRKLDTHLPAVMHLLAQGLSSPRIAEALGIPRSTVRHWVLHYNLRAQAVDQVA